MELGDVLVSLNTGLNPRNFFKLNTSDATNYYVTIREIKNHRIIFSETTDRINDDALYACNHRSNLEVGDVLFSGTGTIGNVALIDVTPTNWNIKEGVYSIKVKQDIVNPRYLLYLLETEHIKNKYMKKVSGGTVKSLAMKDLKMLHMPIPSLEKQKQIVEILDKFDELVNSTKSGLNREIALRQQEYEYWREKLLTF